MAYKLRAKPIPSVPNGFIAYVHASFIKKIFYNPERTWKSHIKHNCKLDDLRAGFKVAKGYFIWHG
jgi:hypothetical protein